MLMLTRLSVLCLWMVVISLPNDVCDASPLYVSDIRCLVCSQGVKTLMEEVDKLNSECEEMVAAGEKVVVGGKSKLPAPAPRWAECFTTTVYPGEEEEDDDFLGLRKDKKDGKIVTHLSKDTIWHLMTNQFKEGEGSKEEDDEDEVENICRIMIKKYTVKPKSQAYDTGNNKDWKFIPNIHYENRHKRGSEKVDASSSATPSGTYGNSIEVSKKLMKACQKHFQTDTLLQAAERSIKDTQKAHKERVQKVVENGCKKACPYTDDIMDWVRDEL